jgi:hypothetical protein
MVQASAAEMNFQISVLSMFFKIVNNSKNYIFSPKAKSPASPNPGTMYE